MRKQPSPDPVDQVLYQHCNGMCINFDFIYSFLAMIRHQPISPIRWDLRRPTPYLEVCQDPVSPLPVEVDQREHPGRAVEALQKLQAGIQLWIVANTCTS